MVLKSGGVSTNKFAWRTRAYQANGFYFRDSNAGMLVKTKKIEFQFFHRFRVLISGLNLFCMYPCFQRNKFPARSNLIRR